MIAYHFPPMKGSSGIQRTLKFCQYLPLFGWQPAVLSADLRAYESTSQEQIADIPEGMVLSRAFALDTKRHLSINGRYPRFFAIPDRWVSWFFGGVLAGYGLVRKTKPSVIWSTYPIATAHLIALALHRLTGIPWVADMRDPMAQNRYPSDPLRWKSYKWIEDKAVQYASAICFTSPSAIEHFIDKHKGTVLPEKVYLIENGYDEENFLEAEKIVESREQQSERPFFLLHSGIVYPKERDPLPLFKAVSNLKKAGIITAKSVQIVFRATGHDAYLGQYILTEEIGDIIKLAPPLPYIEALAEMLTADGLLLLQAANCNFQIPAKLYEYLRSGRPILALTDHHGDTAKIIQRFTNTMITDISSSSDIENQLRQFIATFSTGTKTPEASTNTITYSRNEKGRELAQLFDSIILSQRN